MEIICPVNTHEIEISIVEQRSFRFQLNFKLKYLWIFLGVICALVGLSILIYYLSSDNNSEKSTVVSVVTTGTSTSSTSPLINTTTSTSPLFSATAGNTQTRRRTTNVDGILNVI